MLSRPEDHPEGLYQIGAKVKGLQATPKLWPLLPLHYFYSPLGHPAGKHYSLWTEAAGSCKTELFGAHIRCRACAHTGTKSSCTASGADTRPEFVHVGERAGGHVSVSTLCLEGSLRGSLGNFKPCFRTHGRACWSPPMM